jgi:hypothetical protein
MKNLLKAGIPAMMLVFVLMATGCESPPEMNEPGDAPYGITVSGQGSNKLVLTITGENAKWSTSVNNPAVEVLFSVTGTSEITGYSDVSYSSNLSSSDMVLTVTVIKKNNKTGTVIFSPHSVVINTSLYGVVSSNTNSKYLNVKVTGSPITITID